MVDSNQSETESEEPKKLGLLDLTRLWYSAPLIAILMAFMFQVRTQAAYRFKTGSEILFTGNDAWYHLREVTYTVHHWPNTMPYDIWTRFPEGTTVGQFGTLYDQLIATAALIIGLGSPTEHTIALTLLYAPAVFGTLLAIPVYFLGKRVGNRPGGIFSVIILAVLPGTILQRGLVGFADHNIAEPFFMAIAVIGILAALRMGETEKPVWELVFAKEWDALRNPVKWSVIAAFAISLYLWTWPAGLLLIGIFGVYLAIRAVIDYQQGRSPDHITFIGTVIGVSTSVFMAFTMDTFSFTATELSLLHVGFGFALAAGSLTLAGIARLIETRDTPEYTYPGILFALSVVGFGFMSVVAPDMLQYLLKNVSNTFGLGINNGMATISEAQPWMGETDLQSGITATDLMIEEYGFAFFTAIIATIWMAVSSIRTPERSAEKQFVVVWTVFLTLAAFTQIRFNYYLAVSVVVMNAFLVERLMALLDLDVDVTNIREIDYGKAITVVLALSLILVPVLAPVPIGASGDQKITTHNAVEVGSSTSPGSIVYWNDSLEFLSEDTPAEGTYGVGESGTEMKKYATVERTSDYAYPEGSYGVMSWWDYGHWITVEGDRIPVANPFQENARQAASFLLSQNESSALNRLDARKTAADKGETRYVMVDWKMVHPRSKFNAPVVFNKQDVTRYAKYLYRPTTNNQTNTTSYQYGFAMQKQPYYESMSVRLYKYHGSAMKPSPIVVDWEPIPNAQNREMFGAFPTDDSVVKRFNTTEAARQYAANDSTAQVGGVGAYPVEKVDALKHFRLVHTSRASAFSSGTYMGLTQRLMFSTGMKQVYRTNPSWVKTFERVPGATVEGTAAPNTKVKASVTMKPANGSEFVYTQYATTNDAGTFTMTLPYSTTGYENWGTENGYTNVSVKAVSDYTFTTNNGAKTNVTVTEAQVIGEDDSVVTVTLTNKSG